MSDLLQNYNGGTTDEYGTLLTIDRQMGSGVVEGLLVVANATPNMTVYVQPGSGAILTGSYPSSYNYRFATDTALPGRAVTVGTAAASPRIDYIVAYVDKSVAGSAAGANVNNTNSVLKYADVQGTPAGSPSVPTVAQIQSTIGASNPYMILAQIAVGANVTTITNTNITDLRTFAADRNDAALGQTSYVDSGLVWSATSGLSGSMTAGKAYINVGGTMVPATSSAISGYTFTASQDTYVSINVNGVVNYSPVANNAASPNLPANSVWLAKVVSGASTISSIQAAGLDMNGKQIYPRPNSTLNANLPMKFLVYRNSATNVGAGVSIMQYDSVVFDTANSYDPSTYRINIRANGYYRFSARVSTGVNIRMFSSLYKNGVEYLRGLDYVSSASGASSTLTTPPIYLVAGDYVQLEAYASGTAALEVGLGNLWFGGELVGAS